MSDLNNNMNDSELENWRQIRAQGRARFLLKIILHRCAWFSVPFVVTLLLTGLQIRPRGGFWSEYQFLIWIFAGVTLLIGFGDGVFLWNLREREYLRKKDPQPPRRSVTLRAPRTDPVLERAAERNVLN